MSCAIFSKPLMDYPETQSRIINAMKREDYEYESDFSSVATRKTTLRFIRDLERGIRYTIEVVLNGDVLSLAGEVKKKMLHFADDISLESLPGGIQMAMMRAREVIKQERAASARQSAIHEIYESSDDTEEVNS